MAWGKVKPGSQTDRIRKQLKRDQEKARAEGRIYGGPKGFKRGKFVW